MQMSTAAVRLMVLAPLFGASLLATSKAGAADAPRSEPGDRPASAPADVGRFDHIADRLAGWKVVVGGGALVGPKYEGAKRLDVMPLPLFKAEFGDRVGIDPRGVSVTVVTLGDFKLAARGGYELGRDDKDDRHIRGLGDVDPGGVAGATASYAFGPITLKAELDKTIGGSKGLTGAFGAEASHMFGRVLLSAGASATWADDKHMDAYFSVDRRQSIRSGLRRYDADAGIKRVDFEASATIMLDEHWLVRGQAGIGYLTGDAADSPVVRRKLQPSGMLMVGYRF